MNLPLRLPQAALSWRRLSTPRSTRRDPSPLLPCDFRGQLLRGLLRSSSLSTVNIHAHLPFTNSDYAFCRVVSISIIASIPHARGRAKRNKKIDFSFLSPTSLSFFISFLTPRRLPASALQLQQHTHTLTHTHGTIDSTSSSSPDPQKELLPASLANTQTSSPQITNQSPDGKPHADCSARSSGLE